MNTSQSKTTNPANQLTTSLETTPPTHWRQQGTPVVFALALLAPVITDLYSKWQKKPEPATNTQVDWTQGVQKIRAELAHLNTDAANEEKLVWDSFTHRQAVIVTQYRTETATGIDAAVHSLVQVNQIGWLINDFAQDKAFGGGRAANRVAHCSSQFSQAMKNSAVRTQESVTRLEQGLAAVNHRFATKAGEVIHNEGPKLPRSNFEQIVALEQKIPLTVSVHVAGVTVAGTFEALTAATTASAVCRVVAYLAAKLAPQIAKVALGSSLAAVPLVDMITVGLAAWTVWDVVFLPSNIREEVRHQFVEAAKAQLSALNSDLDLRTKKLFTQSRAFRVNLTKQIEAALP
ncbi:MAG: hypothetical protein NTX04_05760 [Verrucomicrobia bacterium]|nr:hypothetical protein [Verrucomicrobiota bacterium]